MSAMCVDVGHRTRRPHLITRIRSNSRFSRFEQSDVLGKVEVLCDIYSTRVASMREVFVALGLALILSSLGLIAWGALGLRSVDRFEDFQEENFPDWWYHDDITDPAIDRIRAFYIAALVGGLFLLALGAVLAVRGLRMVKGEAPDHALVIPTAPSGERSFCDYCGGTIDPSTVRCPACGRVLKGG